MICEAQHCLISGLGVGRGGGRQVGRSIIRDGHVGVQASSCAGYSRRLAVFETFGLKKQR